MNMLDRIIRRFEFAGRVRTLHVLRGLSDRQLEDAGLSRDLLNQGVTEWPWRVEETSNLDLGAICKVPSIKPAVNNASNSPVQSEEPELETAA